ncbi:MAG: hypothetical protein ACREQ9_26990, partial [Candidatus Binatia bacterium]
HVVRPFLAAVKRGFDALTRFFDKITAPIRAVLERINRALDWVWSKVLAPILDVIGKVRAILQLLAGLGVEWAGKLDQILQLIETRIYDTFREVRNWVNTFELWLDLLLDPGGWIKSFPFLYTVHLWAGNIMGILVNLGLDPLAGDRRQIVRQDNRTRPLTTTVERFRSGYYRDHFHTQRAIARLKSRSFGGE